MKCARCLLQLQCLRLVGQSAVSAAQHGALFQSASSRQPSMPHSTQHQVLRRFHGSPACAKRRPVPAEFINEDYKKRDKSLVTHDDLFGQVANEAKSKATFNKVVEVFTKRDVRRRGHVEFIYAALKKMPEFGVERDLAVYNKLLDVFPKEVFVPRNFIQRMFNHYPRQQECGVQLLEQMENYGIMPNVETKVLLVQIFGEKSHPMRKYQRVMYWFPKFKYINPFPVPQLLPADPVDLARFTLTRIANDLDAEVTVYQSWSHGVVTWRQGENRSPGSIHSSTAHVPTPRKLSCVYLLFPLAALYRHHRDWTAGIQSPIQREQLAQHNPSRPLFVEGPFPLWLRKTCVYYYILRADPTPPDEKVQEAYDPERCLGYPLQLDLDLDCDLGDEESFDVEDLDEGPVFAMCMTSQGDQATLNQWISGLQQNNPILGQVPTLFRLEAGTKELQGTTETESGHHHRPDPETQTEERQPEEEPELIVEEEPRRSQGMKQ